MSLSIVQILQLSNYPAYILPAHPAETGDSYLATFPGEALDAVLTLIVEGAVRSVAVEFIIHYPTCFLRRPNTLLHHI